MVLSTQQSKPVLNDKSLASLANLSTDKQGQAQKRTSKVLSKVDSQTRSQKSSVANAASTIQPEKSKAGASQMASQLASNQMAGPSIMSIVSKKQKNVADADVLKSIEHNSLLNTARSDFPTSVNDAYHMHSYHAKKDGTDKELQDVSFIAQS